MNACESRQVNNRDARIHRINRPYINGSLLIDTRRMLPTVLVNRNRLSLLYFWREKPNSQCSHLVYEKRKSFFKLVTPTTEQVLLTFVFVSLSALSDSCNQEQWNSDCVSQLHVLSMTRHPLIAFCFFSRGQIAEIGTHALQEAAMAYHAQDD